jgi:hypothetical protein
MNMKISGRKELWNKMLLKNSSGGTEEHSKTKVKIASLRAGFGIR